MCKKKLILTPKLNFALSLQLCSQKGIYYQLFAIAYLFWKFFVTTGFNYLVIISRSTTDTATKIKEGYIISWTTLSTR